VKARALHRAAVFGRLVAPIAALLVASGAFAHDSRYGFLRLDVGEERIDGEWEIHLRDARIALGLPGDATGDSAWAELRERAPALQALLKERIVLATGAGACEPVFEPAFEERPGGRDYALNRFTARCDEKIGQLRIHYELLFDLDDNHRAFLAVADAYQTHLGVFTGAQRDVVLDIRQLDRWEAFGAYLREGVRHIWLGADHLLFLVALLLPAPLRRVDETWRPRERRGAVAREVVKIVTAFTLAHSLTLTLAVIGVVQLPVRWVEASIAASVFAAAWNNLRPFLRGRIWLMAFAFGLVHGLGFASALTQLGLPRAARGLALLAFNLGVEVGQLAVVAVLLPVIFAARRTRAYRQLALGVGSLLIAWAALIWLIERAFQIDLVPFL